MSVCLIWELFEGGSRQLFLLGPHPFTSLIAINFEHFNVRYAISIDPSKA
jgi:hypothetical protein